MISFTRFFGICRQVEHDDYPHTPVASKAHNAGISTYLCSPQIAFRTLAA